MTERVAVAAAAIFLVSTFATILSLLLEKLFLLIELEINKFICFSLVGGFDWHVIDSFLSLTHIKHLCVLASKK